MHAFDEFDETAGTLEVRPAVLRRLIPLFRPHGRTLVYATGLLAATTAAQLAGPLLIRRAIDVDIANRKLGGLLLTVAAYVVVQAAFLGLDFVKKVRLEIMGQDITLGLRTRLYSHLLSQPVSFFDDNPPGRLISRVQGDTDALRQMFALTIVTLVEALALFAGMLIVMSTVSGRLTLVVAGMFPLMITAAWLIATGGARRFREVRRLAAEISAYIAERIQGLPLIQAYAREDMAVRELDDLNREKYRKTRYAELYEMTLFHGIFFLEVAGIAVVLWFGGRWTLAGLLTVGTLVMFIEYLRRLFDPIMRLSEQLDVMLRAAAAAGRVFTLLDVQPAVTDPANPSPWKHLEREIEFRDVSFSYGDDGDKALHDVSFRIPRGQTWAIVGATGAGKSTIFNLLLRFYDPQRGDVRLDGIDVREMSQADLRARMALVMQDVYLFPGDVLSNLTLSGDGDSDGDGTGEATPGALPAGRESSDSDSGVEEHVRRAAMVVGADRFIERLPGGYRARLAERGANLSAGERQLLSFARALASDPDILLLDEATAAVDPETEGRLQLALASLLSGRTALVIAHRLSTVRDADGILVMRGGRIVEQGGHEELLDRGGVYADLYALQFGNGRIVKAAPGPAGPAGPTEVENDSARRSAEGENP